MNKVIRATVVALVLAMFSGMAMADDGAAKEGSHKKGGEMAKKAMPELVDMTLTGKLITTDVEKTLKDGKKTTYTRYWLEDANGKKIALAKPHAKKGEKVAVNLDDYVGKQVSIKAKGVVKGEGDKAKQYPKELLSIEEVAAP